MAIIKVTTTGSGLKGKVGDVYYKTVNGKQVVCSMPTTYRTPQDDVSKNNRNNIKFLSFISKSVTEVDFFYDMWFLDELKGTGPYHKFLGFNHPGKEMLDFTKIKLSPSSEINAELEGYSVTTANKAKQINVSVKPLDETSGINNVRERFIALGGFFIKPGNLKKKPISMLMVPVQVTPLVMNEPLNFTIQLKGNPGDRYTLLLLLATLNSTEEQLRYSDTFVFAK